MKLQLSNFRMTSISLKNVDKFPLDILQMSVNKQYQDITIACDDGRTSWNKCVVASVFPFLRNLLSKHEEECELLFPGFKLSEFESLFQNIQKQKGIFYVSKDLAKYVCDGKIGAPENLKEKTKTDFKIPTLVNISFKSDVDIKEYASSESDDEDYRNDEDFDPGSDEDLDPNSNEKFDPNFNADFKNCDIPDESVKLKIRRNKTERIAKFNCSECDFTTNNKTEHMNHRKYEHENSGNSLMECEICGKGVKVRNYKLHKSLVHSTTDACRECGKKIHLMGTIKIAAQHLARCSIQKIRYPCKICGLQIMKKDMEAHMENKHSGANSTCDICGRVLARGTKLARHRRICAKKQKHVNLTAADLTQTKKCDNCGLDVVISALATHDCEGSFVCVECGKIFRYKNSLKHHEKTIHGEIEKQFSCTDCGRSFSSISALNVHLLTHQEKEICVECGKAVRDMKRHIAIMHTPDEEQPFRCNDCGKGFMRLSMLKHHQLTNHLKEEGPFKCRFGCKKEYKYKADVKRHEKVKHNYFLPNEPLSRHDKKKLKLQNIQQNDSLTT